MPKLKRPGDAKRESKKAAFLRAFKKLGGIWVAADHVGLSGNTIWKWRQDDAAFDEAVLRADETATDELERIAVERAKKKSDLLMIFTLKGKRPEKYRDNARVEHAGEVKVTIVNYSLKAEGAVPPKKPNA